MGDLKGKNILLGICGGIAAYKSAVLCRDLVTRGAEVRVVMTQSATQFITPLTMQALSGHPVQSDIFDAESDHGMGHIELARWADLILVAPASANTISRIAHGRADDLLATTVLASTASLVLAPAMNQQMWSNQATLDNIKNLESRGMSILGPDSGEQACGEQGAGRMIEPESIADHVESLVPSGLLRGINVTITAGPTWEAIDPVRGITNHSSGKMGYALANAIIDEGANVTLVSGPTAMTPPAAASFVAVTSALEMSDAVMKDIHSCDIFIGVAAVADYRPVLAADEKIKKEEEYLNLELVRNPDILADVAALDRSPFTVGFAAETENLIAHAQKKLSAKGIDMIAANDVAGELSAFGSDSNELLVIDKNGTIHLDRGSKIQIARLLTKEIAQRYHETYPA
jgi:phosphopantothenoylcysteine decarboxylase/phosphopantothenate--cysteine ligase